MVQAEVLVNAQFCGGVAGDQLHGKAQHHDGGAQHYAHRQPVPGLGECPELGADGRGCRGRGVLVQAVIVG
ncbi:hypothetical protein NicSoilC5_18520 [Arthrobacter sp. NicSoilC5]|nr:hypothetical protein NicSoilC5_18520 [Arthrobacter sp. NicSoilC5]